MTRPQQMSLPSFGGGEGSVTGRAAGVGGWRLLSPDSVASLDDVIEVDKLNESLPSCINNVQLSIN